jgi:hypothetical protein
VAAALDHEVLVGGADEIDQRPGARERHDVIVGERDREHGAPDRGELRGAAAHGERAGDQAVPAVQLLDVLLVAGARERDVVVAPALGGEEAVEELVVPRAIEQGRQLRGGERRLQQVKRRLHQRPRHVAERVDDRAHVERGRARPGGHDAGVLEVDRRRERGECGDAVGERGAVRGRERAPEAVAEQVRPPGGARGEPHGAAEVAPADVVPRQVAILAAGRAPVDAQDLVALGDEPLDERAPGAEIEDVPAIDERRHEQDGRPVAARARREAEQPPLVLGPGDGVRRLPDGRHAARRAADQGEERVEWAGLGGAAPGLRVVLRGHHP